MRIVNVSMYSIIQQITRLSIQTEIWFMNATAVQLPPQPFFTVIISLSPLCTVTTPEY